MRLRRVTAILGREDDGLVALCPELDIASRGSPIEEARANLVEALTLFFASADASEVERRPLLRPVLPSEQESPTVRLPAPEQGERESHGQACEIRDLTILRPVQTRILHVEGVPDRRRRFEDPRVRHDGEEFMNGRPGNGPGRRAFGQPPNRRQGRPMPGRVFPHRLDGRLHKGRATIYLRK
jgi:predicted RNase H-like HicB family nuclease